MSEVVPEEGEALDEAGANIDPRRIHQEAVRNFTTTIRLCHRQGLTYEEMVEMVGLERLSSTELTDTTAVLAEHRQGIAVARERQDDAEVV